MEIELMIDQVLTLEYVKSQIEVIERSSIILTTSWLNTMFTFKKEDAAQIILCIIRLRIVEQWKKIVTMIGRFLTLENTDTIMLLSKTQECCGEVAYSNKNNLQLTKGIP